MWQNKSLNESIRELIKELNPAYDKHRKNREMMQRIYKEKYGKDYQSSQGLPQHDPEKAKLFHEVVSYMSKFIDLPDPKKRIIWEKISKMSKDTEYWLRSYMKKGTSGWKDVKEFVLPGFQE